MFLLLFSIIPPSSLRSGDSTFSGSVSWTLLRFPDHDSSFVNEEEDITMVSNHRNRSHTSRKEKDYYVPVLTRIVLCPLYASYAPRRSAFVMRIAGFRIKSKHAGNIASAGRRGHATNTTVEFSTEATEQRGRILDKAIQDTERITE